MTNPRVGGRGRKAPYETQHYRIPVPIKPVIQMLAKAFSETYNYNAYDPKAEKLIQRVENAIAIATDGRKETSSGVDQHSDVNQYENLRWDVQSLEQDLATAQAEITRLKAERQKTIDILALALRLPANAGGKIKTAIKEAFPELKN